MAQDPNHPIWKQINEEAAQVRGKLDKDLEDYENGAIHMYHHNTPGDVKYVSELMFNNRDIGWDHRPIPLEPRRGTQSSGKSDGVNGPKSPEWYRTHTPSEWELTDKGKQRNTDIAARADKAENVVNRRGSDYETKVFPAGTYPGQTDHFAVSYHKPTGVAAASMKYDSTGHVHTWAEDPDHKGGAAGLAVGVAAHKHLKSIGHVSGALHAEMTTPESHRVLKAMDPYSTSLYERNEIDSYTHGGSVDMVHVGMHKQGLPENLGDVSTRPTNEDFARLSDMTGRHPMNFMAMSTYPRDRMIAEHEGYGAGPNSKLDPTVMTFVNQREERSPLHEENDTTRAADRRFEVTQRAQRRQENNAARFADEDGWHLESHNPFVREADAGYHQRTLDRADRTNGIRETRVTGNAANILSDAGMYVHEEPHTPRTTEERLAQDPLARARIIRGKAFYSDREVGHGE
jgi:hypothetical protein